MARLIDADQFKAKLLSLMNRKAPTPSDTDCILDGVLNLLEEQPTKTPVKHGHWIKDGQPNKNSETLYRCSICGYLEVVPLYDTNNYCGNCGAKMDSKEGG